VSFSRGLFGKPPNPAHIEKVLRDLSLWDKRTRQDHDAVRRHEAPRDDRQGAEPRAEILFLDEPTRRRRRRAAPRHVADGARPARSGVTIILTTHYIEEAEEMADRIGVISKGELILVEDKNALMRKLGKKQLTLQLQRRSRMCRRAGRYALEAVRRRPPADLQLRHPAERHRHRRPAAPAGGAGIDFKDLHTEQSSLEDIFVSLVRTANEHSHAIRAIYRFEMARTGARWAEHCLAGAVDLALLRRVRLGHRLAHGEIDGVSYGAFIVPGLIMLSLLTESISNASFGIYMPAFRHDLRAAVGAGLGRSRSVIGYVGAAATKSIVHRLMILATARSSCRFRSRIRLDARLPGADRGDIQPVRLHHRRLGRRLREAADRAAADRHAADLPRRHVLFDRHAAPFWQTITLFNPVVYLISGFRWSFYGEQADVRVGVSLAAAEAGRR
jgi:hypothetical protein